MSKEEYGEHFEEHFLDQYKLYVQMADNISERRGQANVFYTSILSALVTILALTSQEETLTDILYEIHIAITFLGMLICATWFLTIRSYKQLNTGKFKVIHEMEQKLPYACYDREWELLGKGQRFEKYFQLTRVEQFIPFLMAIPFIIIFLLRLFSSS